MATRVTSCILSLCQVTATYLKTSVATFTKEGSQRLAKSPLVFNGRLANLGLTSLVKEATDFLIIYVLCSHMERMRGCQDINLNNGLGDLPYLNSPKPTVVMMPTWLSVTSPPLRTKLAP